MNIEISEVANLPSKFGLFNVKAYKEGEKELEQYDDTYAKIAEEGGLDYSKIFGPPKPGKSFQWAQEVEDRVNDIWQTM